MRAEQTEHNSGFAKLPQRSKARILEINKSSGKSSNVFSSLLWLRLLLVTASSDDEFYSPSHPSPLWRKNTKNQEETNKMSPSSAHLPMHWIWWTVMLFNEQVGTIMCMLTLFPVLSRLPFPTVHFVNCRIFWKNV